LLDTASANFCSASNFSNSESLSSSRKANFGLTVVGFGAFGLSWTINELCLETLAGSSFLIILFKSLPWITSSSESTSSLTGSTVCSGW